MVKLVTTPPSIPSRPPLGAHARTWAIRAACKRDASSVRPPVLQLRVRRAAPTVLTAETQTTGRAAVCRAAGPEARAVGRTAMRRAMIRAGEAWTMHRAAAPAAAAPAAVAPR